MENVKKVSDEVGIAGQVTPPNQLQQAAQEGAKGVMLKKLIGGFLVVIGFLLSPLCWWNDLFFNLPIAYSFGYVCNLFSPNLLVPCSIIGYWLSNIVGILMMQVGSVDVFQGQPKDRNLKKELLTGLVSSTVFTLIVMALMHFKILDAPVLFSVFPYSKEI